LKKFIQIIALALLSARAQAVPLTVVVGEIGSVWPRVIGAEIGIRQHGSRIDGIVVVMDEQTINLPDTSSATSIHFICIGNRVAAIADIIRKHSGTKIDQFTTIDSPTAIEMPGNVLFADNYFQTNGAPRGALIPGAYNQQMTAFGPDYSGSLLSWYYQTMSRKDVSGYPFADCAHGIRPLVGFRTRRVGQPDLRFQYDAKRKTFSWEFGGAATGQYFLEQSADLKTWISASPDVLTFDGLSFQTPQIGIDLSVFQHWFYRLRSDAASF